MRRIGAFVATATLAAALFCPPPSAAFGLHFGRFHFGSPFFGHRHRHRVALPPAAFNAGLRDKANLDAVEPGQGLTSAFLYPALALPAVYDDVFWPPSSPPWPFTYEAIFQMTFAKVRPDEDSNACQRADHSPAIVAYIKNKIRPTGPQLQQLRKLGGALGMASGYLAKTCLDGIPLQPIARLQFTEWQVEKLAQALDIIRQPLQDFEQSLNDRQRARFAGTLAAPAGRVHAYRANDMIPTCVAAPTAVDWSIEQISLSVQPTDAQRDTMTNIKQAFSNAASQLDANCPLSVPQSPLARLVSTEARLDATWRAIVSIQVALANVEAELSNEQRIRLDATDLAATQ